MRETTVDKIHIFISMFFISLAMSIQSPIFTPYAAILGASSVLIGIMLGASQLANLTGNLIVGPLVDRYGKRLFITLPLFASGLLYIGHGFAPDSISLLVLRTMNGFSLAFLMPAALTLLSSYAKNSQQQGKNMAINGMLGMVAAIIAPLIGGKLGVTIGYAKTYFVIGIALVCIAVYTIFFIRDRQITIVRRTKDKSTHLLSVLGVPKLQLVYLTGFAVMYIHGVILYEIPYLTVERGISTINTGQLFSFMAIGSLLSLSLLFVHRFNPMSRMIAGLFLMSLTAYAISSGFLGLPVLMLIIGGCFGIIMPAAATVITDATTSEMHGRAFGVLSAIYSVGMILSSFLTPILRTLISPYFIAFLVGMILFTFIGYINIRISKITNSPNIVK